MPEFTLDPFIEIPGIGAASGLVFHQKTLFIISDNSRFLYQYDTATNTISKLALYENAGQNIPKALKPDFESIILKDNKIYLFGSGSTEKRNRQLIYNLNTKTISEEDLSETYTILKEKAFISNEDFNIEGVLFYKDNWYLFQRGNGIGAKNGIFIFDDDVKNVKFQVIELPKIQNIQASFTDAIVIKDKIYFLAAAENTISTYEDGEILGSFLGIINSETLALEKTILLSETHKFEGLAFFEEAAETITFLLCEDNDSEQLQSRIYKLIISQSDQLLGEPGTETEN